VGVAMIVAMGAMGEGCALATLDVFRAVREPGDDAERLV